jgi:predicted Zn-dependent protease
MDRLSMLLNMVTTKPGDPFPRYGLAMEYKRLGRPDEAVQAFNELAEHHPKYVPGYLMHGNLLETMGRPADARSVYERGLAVASAAGDDHAESELRSARDALT